MTNKNRTVLYTGMTHDLARRVYEHQSGDGCAFTKRYQVKDLVFFDRFDNPTEAIAAEKRIKAGSRRKKIDLIEDMNPEWRDLMETMG